MAENVLARILDGITKLTNDAEIRMVLAAAQEHKQVLTEKRKVDKENLEMEHRLQGRGVTEADQKRL